VALGPLDRSQEVLGTVAIARRRMGRLAVAQAVKLGADRLQLGFELTHPQLAFAHTGLERRSFAQDCFQRPFELLDSLISLRELGTHTLERLSAAFVVVEQLRRYTCGRVWDALEGRQQLLDLALGLRLGPALYRDELRSKTRAVAVLGLEREPALPRERILNGQSRCVPAGDENLAERLSALLLRLQSLLELFLRDHPHLDQEQAEQ